LALNTEYQKLYEIRTIFPLFPIFKSSLLLASGGGLGCLKK